MMFLVLCVASLASITIFFLHYFYLARVLNPLRKIAGPPVTRRLNGHLVHVLDASISPRVHEYYVQKYGRSIRIQGIGPWDQRLLSLDPLSVSHVLKNTAIYEKPWQSRRLITSLIGCGMLAAEGQVHKRQRRVATPAFSIQNLRALTPVVFRKGGELKDRWLELMSHQSDPQEGLRLDVCHWISRATFDVIGLAGFDYNLNAIQNESNELFLAYKEMFEVALSQGQPLRTLFRIYAPFLSSLFPDETIDTINRGQKVIQEVAGYLVQEKKRKIKEGMDSGQPYAGKDLLTLLLKSNVAVDLPPEQRISDEDILNNINTFMFAGSDTSSLSLTWTLLLLAQHPSIQDRLRSELVSAIPNYADLSSDLSEEEIQSVYEIVAELPFLHNIVRECIRLIPPVHSSIRVATQDDEIPTSYPVHMQDGQVQENATVKVAKGTFLHVAVEAFNLDKDMWGPDAWEFQPDRWDNLPEAVKTLPGLFYNTLTFSAGPRSCIGMRFSMIEIKSFLFVLLTNFMFKPTDEKIIKANVVLTRPYLSGHYKDGSQCPLLVIPLKR